jgi:hypothetical protein
MQCQPWTRFQYFIYFHVCVSQASHELQVTTSTAFNRTNLPLFFCFQQGILNPMSCPLLYYAQTRAAPEHAITAALCAMTVPTANTTSDTLPDHLMAPSITVSPTAEATKQTVAYTSAFTMPLTPRITNWTGDIDDEKRIMNIAVADAVCQSPEPRNVSKSLFIL